MCGLNLLDVTDSELDEKFGIKALGDRIRLRVKLRELVCQPYNSYTLYENLKFCIRFSYCITILLKISQVRMKIVKTMLTIGVLKELLYG